MNIAIANKGCGISNSQLGRSRSQGKRDNVIISSSKSRVALNSGSLYKTYKTWREMDKATCRRYYDVFHKIREECAGNASNMGRTTRDKRTTSYVRQWLCGCLAIECVGLLRSVWDTKGTTISRGGSCT